MANTKLKDESILWSIYHNVSQSRRENHLSRDETRELVIEEFSSAYGISADRINRFDENSLYPLVSKIMRLVFPNSAAAERNLLNELDRGQLGFNDGLEIARGNAVTREDCKSQKRNESPQIVKGLSLETVFSALIQASLDSGQSLASVRRSFEGALENFEAEEDDA